LIENGYCPVEYKNMVNELDCLYSINQIIKETADWKIALDQIVKLIRAIFIFDNLALFLPDDNSKLLEIAYARAVGRGRSSGSDISWGIDSANQVMNSRELVLQYPTFDSGETETNRLNYPFILGIPLKVHDHLLGILVFIRFGGPEYTPNNIRLASFISDQISRLLEVKYLNRLFSILQEENQQSRLQDSFISTISHELLTPLGFIKGYATTLLRADTSWDESNRREFLTIIDQETDRLQELIDNILDSTRLQTGSLPMVYQPVRLDVLIRDVVMRTRHSNKNLQVNLKIDTPISHIQGDPRRLAQVFENLISNAVKYAPGSDVSITLNQDKEWLTTVVSDKGPGVHAQYLPHLFERFYRSPDQAMNIRGTGLGLYICRQIIEAHQGKISIESVVGEGTTIRISLPAALKNKSTIKSGIERMKGTE
jgi:signal transduction histidine kinase